MAGGDRELSTKMTTRMYFNSELFLSIISPQVLGGGVSPTVSEDCFVLSDEGNSIFIEMGRKQIHQE